MKMKYDIPLLLVEEIYTEQGVATASVDTGEGSGPVIENENEQTDDNEWIIDLED